MKTLVKNYIFSPSTREITFSDYTSIELERILLITNATTNEIIYNFANPLLGGSITGNVVTLTLDVTAMDAEDKLQIFYEADIAPATDLAIEENTNVAEALHALVSLLSFLPAVRGVLADLRVTPTGTVTIAGSLTALTTLTTLTNMAQMGGFPLNTVPKSFDNQLAVLGNINNVSITV